MVPKALSYIGSIACALSLSTCD